MSPSPAYLAYSALTSGLFLFGFPPFLAFSHATGRTPARLSERLGRYPATALSHAKGSPRIWLHAVSVGEAAVAAQVAQALAARLPGCGVVLSTSTATGQEHAMRLAGDRAACVFAPIDFIGSVRQALKAIRPDVMAFIETELWPNWIVEATRRNVLCALVNGRISERSIGRYMKLKPLFASVLGRMDAFSMISEKDAERIRRMGAPSGRVTVSGNAKYGGLAGQATQEARDRVARVLGLEGGCPVFVAGSTRTGEEEAVLDAFQDVRRAFGAAKLILAPRHVERTDSVGALIRARGLAFQTYTDLEASGSGARAPVVLVNRIGPLFSLYSAADVVFCGGSLVDLGGQNLMEPAAWGKPVLYGPHTGDFADARTFLENTGGGLLVKDGKDLSRQVLHLLQQQDQALAMGENARRAAASQAGAAQRHAEVLIRLLR